MRRPRFIRTSIFRLALLYATLFGASVLVIFAVIYWATASAMSSELKNIVEAELATLKHSYESGGTERLISSLQDLVASHGPQGTYYLLQDEAGIAVAGNLAPQAKKAGWQKIPTPRQGDEWDEGDVLEAKGLILPNGYFLLVGDDGKQFKETLEIIERAFGWGVAVTLCLALLGGVVMGAGMLRRVDSINRISEEIMDGSLARRIPVSGSGDDFDQVAANINEMLERIQVLMGNLTQVSNDIAHDLRTPLTRLRHRLESARGTAKSVADYDAAVGKAIGETDEILRTFGAILRIAQIEAGSRRAAFTAVDLSQLVDGIANTYVAVAEDRGQSLVADVASGLRVRGDRELLTQMLVNCIENALCHTPPGTQIQIELADGPSGPECVIADSGPGIPEAERQNVLRRFYRLEASRARSGSGLGLSLVAAVADLHRIRMELSDNRPGLRVKLQFRDLAED